MKLLVVEDDPPLQTALLRLLAQWGYAAEQATYREASPLLHASHDAPPLLLIHGDADELVPFEQSQLLLAALQDKGAASDLLTVPGGGHGPDFPGAVNAPDYLTAAVNWFDRHLSASVS